MGAKDRLIEALALPILNGTLLAPYGQARELRLDTTGKRAEILLDLHGESEPLRITVGRYRIFERDGETFVSLHDIETSRAWMTTLAERAVEPRALKLPPELAGALSRWI